MDNFELTPFVASIDATLKDLLSAGIAATEGLTGIDDELSLIRRSAFPPRPRSANAWPWTPETTIQGFLSGRWLRRDGNVYGSPAP
jgi:hypothetical protein